MKIIAEVIPHKDQKYPTVGNWFFKNPDTLHVEVSDTGNRVFNFLVAHHEITEAFLCSQKGIGAAMVDEFDMAYEARRATDDDSEPGDDPHAPYKREHCIATGIERILAAELGVDWKTYEETLDSL